eukprot:GHVR01081923.1.p1 GENE.GHVR01081923.1~~GHVR01081923.1.p1  ORF type:complete len:103 (+),score=26.78 GHVR01081923.1:312-620(+)
MKAFLYFRVPTKATIMHVDDLLVAAEDPCEILDNKIGNIFDIDKAEQLTMENAFTYIGILKATHTLRRISARFMYVYIYMCVCVCVCVCLVWVSSNAVYGGA